jgi:hypothetical protein
MEQKAIDALRWLTEILNRHHVEYQIAGGFAANVYGSPRELNDIDVDIREKDFRTILPDIAGYVTAGPTRFNDGKFDCEYISLKYRGQVIDISGTDTLRMSNKERTEWISYPNFVFDTLDMPVEGLHLKIVHPRKLIEYKKELDGEHQTIDIRAAEEYVRKNGL